MNSNSTTVGEQIAHLGYDFILVDGQHAPLSSKKLSAVLCGIASGGAKSMVRVSSPKARGEIQQALDLGADGVLIPYVNNADEVRDAVSCCKYPTQGTRSVYFPQRSTNKRGLLPSVGNANKETCVAIQIETADAIKNIDAIAAVPGVDMLFLGQNDLCMSLGLFETYEFPKMYYSPELQAATDKLIAAAKRNNVPLGLFLFGTERVGEFIKKGFTFISIGNDLHHILTQAQAHMGTLKTILSEYPPVEDAKRSNPPEPTPKKLISTVAATSNNGIKMHGDLDDDGSTNLALAASAVGVLAVLGYFLYRQSAAKQ